MESDPTDALFYNIWVGRYPGALTYFLTNRIPDLDIYCFTEVTTHVEDGSPAHIYTSAREREPPMSTDSLAILRQALPGYRYTFSARGEEAMTCHKTKWVIPKVRFGSALFLRPNLAVIEIGETLICADQPGRHPRVLQWVVYTKETTRYLIAHLHGVWIKENTKGDHPVRFQQSMEIRMCLAQVALRYEVTKIVFGGDLNLALETQALARLLDGPGSDQVFINLITKYRIKCTRTELYRKYYTPGESHHADYVIVSPEVTCHHFAVMNNVRISDHAPLLVRFS